MVSKSLSQIEEGGVRVCGIAVLGYFWCGVAVIFISKYGIAVFRVQAVCGKFKFYVAVVGEKIVVSRYCGILVLPCAVLRYSYPLTPPS